MDCGILRWPLGCKSSIEWRCLPPPPPPWLVLLIAPMLVSFAVRAEEGDMDAEGVRLLRESLRCSFERWCCWWLCLSCGRRRRWEGPWVAAGAAASFSTPPKRVPKRLCVVSSVVDVAMVHVRGRGELLRGAWPLGEAEEAEE